MDINNQHCIVVQLYRLMGREKDTSRGWMIIPNSTFRNITTTSIQYFYLVYFLSKYLDIDLKEISSLIVQYIY